MASLRPTTADASDRIVCYPLSAAVTAQVMFHPREIPMYSSSSENSTPANPETEEPVICFMASAQVLPSVAFKTKGQESANYVQWDGNFGRPGGLLGGGGLLGKRAGMATPTPGQKLRPDKPGNLVVPDITPGRTPLGSTLVNPASIQRLPTSNYNSTKMPAYPSYGNNGSSNPASLLPPLK